MTEQKVRELTDSYIKRILALDLTTATKPEMKKILSIDADTAEAFGILISSMDPVKSKTGHWILDDCKEHGRCSECGSGEYDLVGGINYKYCPNCGAYMWGK